MMTALSFPVIARLFFQPAARIWECRRDAAFSPSTFEISLLHFDLVVASRFMDKRSQ
jgi:hypothetical protein